MRRFCFHLSIKRDIRMSLSRHALMASALAAPAIARAQGGWRPDRQITMIVAYAAGGGAGQSRHDWLWHHRHWSR